MKHRREEVLEQMAQEMAARLRSLFGARVLGPDKPPVARIQTLFIRKIMLKVENNAPVARVRSLLTAVQREVSGDERFKGAWVYYDVDPL